MSPLALELHGDVFESRTACDYICGSAVALFVVVYELHHGDVAASVTGKRFLLLDYLQPLGWFSYGVELNWMVAVLTGADSQVLGLGQTDDRQGCEQHGDYEFVAGHFFSKNFQRFVKFRQTFRSG